MMQRRNCRLAAVATFAVACLFCFVQVKSDLPVHCLGDEFLGSWHMKVTKPLAKNLHSGAEVCGHTRPDDFTLSMRNNDHFEAWWYDRLPQHDRATVIVESYTLCVPHANGTDAQLCEGASVTCTPRQVEQSAEGCQAINFTMLYDEGFVVSAKVDEVDVKFVGFFRYRPKVPLGSEDEYPPLGSLSEYESLCGETITGVYSARGDEVQQGGKFYNGCFVAKKNSQVPVHSSEMRKNLLKTVSEEAVVSPEASLLQLQEDDSGAMRARDRVRARSAARAHESFLSFLDSTVMISEAFVQHVNEMDAGWMANSTSASSFTKSSHRNALQRMGITSPSMLQSYQGDFDVMRTGTFSDSRAHNKGAMIQSQGLSAQAGDALEAEVIEHSLEYEVAETRSEVSADVAAVDCAIKHLPRRFDWSDEHTTRCPGVVAPTVDQGSCGSCYAVSAADAATSRLRIAKHPSEECRFGLNGSDSILNTTLSAQSVLDCSFVNQGCEGGYPMLAGFHGFAVGWTTTSCDPYLGESKTCNLNSTCQRYFAHDFTYVGGLYGYKTDMTSMMVDLIMHGPVGIAIDAPTELQVYQEGVFRPLFDARHDTLEGPHSYWQKTNHAVLVVGYDVLPSKGKDVPVWRIQNSWGEDWGDHGFFYLPRGEDLISSETMPVSIRFADGPSSKVGEETLRSYYQCMAGLSD